MELFNLNKKKADFIKIKVEKLVDWNEPNGDGCVVSDKITKEGFKVGYMYREKPEEGRPDSGWRFLAGNEELMEIVLEQMTVRNRYSQIGRIDNLRLKEFVCILDLEYFVREYEEQEVAVCVIFQIR